LSAINSPDYTELLHLNLASKLSLHQYWIGLVYRLGFDSQVYQTLSAPSLDILSRYFDTTQLGMLRVFHLFDKDQDNNLTFDEIARGLKQQGIYTNAGSPTADEAFKELCLLLAPADLQSSSESEPPVFSLGSSRGGDSRPQVVGDRVRAPEFLAVLKNLRLAALFCGPSVDVASMKLHLFEYREDQLFAACPLEAPLNFIFKHGGYLPQPASLGSTPETAEGSHFRVRWVHVHEPTRLETLALGMKYGLDPRFISDVFTLWREPAKCDQVNRYGSALDSHHSPTTLLEPLSGATLHSPGLEGYAMGSALSSPERPLWFFVVVPVLRLSEYAKETLRPYQAWKRLKLKKLHKPESPLTFK
jgi:hypothetical protein